MLELLEIRTERNQQTPSLIYLYSSIHLFNKCLLSTYYETGTTKDTGDEVKQSRSLTTGC